MSQATEPRPQKERRRHIRFSRDFPLTLLDCSKKLLDTDSRLVDISRGGLGFATSSPRGPGERILFRLEVPEEGLIAGDAVTRWCRPDTDGFRYLSGAEIRSLRWGHSSKLKRFLGPGASRTLEELDFILLAACAGVGLWIYQDLAGGGAARTQQALLSVFDWLPQTGLILASLIGIVLLLRR